MPHAGTPGARGVAVALGAAATPILNRGGTRGLTKGTAAGLAAVALLLASCGGGRTDSPPTDPAPTHDVSSPSPVESASANPAPGAVEGFTHGGSYWAVYIFVGASNDADYAASIERLENRGLRRGYSFSDGELRCDDGAAEALGLPEDEATSAMAIAVHFEDEQDARAFGDSLAEPPVGVVRVRTRCAD